ncbi:hypothetical protein Sjap_018197 [Stephania japonica]|uniref:UDP-glucose:glycoprotein glucosyltransferase n=1 Tax=Stephania japonica TaxID=461633 RepID=A0AAP0NJ39_9MAGN
MNLRSSRGRTGWSLLILLLCAATLVSAAPPPPPPRSKNVQVSLRAKWPGTPFLLEAGELLSKQWKDLFWDFIEVWLREKDDSESPSAKHCMQRIVKSGRSLLPESLASLFELSLTLRSSSARLEVYRKLAGDSLFSFPSAVDATGNDQRTDHLHMGSNATNPSGNCCWVDIGGSLLYDVPELQLWLSTSVRDRNGSELPELFDFDHVHPDSLFISSVAVLYGALGTDCFKKFHSVLLDASKNGRVKYVVRPVLPFGCERASEPCGILGAGDPINLGGYGVELALKNMEYKAMDDSAIKKGVTLEDPHIEDLSQEVRGFIFSKILERKPDMKTDVMAFRDYLLSLTVSDTLEVWELKDLGHQTAQRIVHASDPLQSMQEINQNFPNIVSSLSRMKINDSIKDEINANQRMLPPGKSLMAVNGALVNIEDIDIYTLIDMVHQELSLADQFSKLKIPRGIIRRLLSKLPPSEANILRIDFRSSHVHYLNNLEEDSMYRWWRNNINDLLMPVFPGQLRYIRKNIFHAVYVLDPASTCGLEAIDTITSMYENSFPMRFGVILYSSKLIVQIEENGGNLPPFIVGETSVGFEEDLSSLIIRLFNYIEENHGTQLAFQFLSNVNRLRNEESSNEILEGHHVEGAFVETLLSKVKSPPQDVLLKVEKELTFKEKADESSLFVYSLGLSELRCCLLMNGIVYEPTEDSLVNAMNDELPRIQEQVYYGHINSHTNVLDKFLSENAHRRYNPQIIGDGKAQKKYVSLLASVLGSDSILKDMAYLHFPETVDGLKPVTHLVAVDVTSVKGMKLLHEGIHYLMSGPKRARLGVLFTFGTAAHSSSYLFMKAFEFTAASFSHKQNVLNFLDQLCSIFVKDYMSISLTDVESPPFIEVACELAKTNMLNPEDYKAALSNFSVDVLKNHLTKVSHFLRGQLGLDFGVSAVITNGRVMAPMEGSSFLSHDFSLLESVEYEQRIKHLAEIIEGVEWHDIDPDALTSKFLSDLVMFVSSSMASRERNPEGARFEVLNAEYSAVVLNNEDSSIHIDAVIDPLSPLGQRLSPLLHMLWKCIQPSMRIVLNPLSSIVDLPLKNYYRFVLPMEDDVSTVDYSISGPKAFFSNMPLSKTLTMNLDVPEPWLVEPVIAIHDLDNILLENLGDTRTLQAVFELEALVLTGHCSEKDHDPPRGLQLILGTKSKPHLVDTLVMANLGYWQMKVSPGVWYLQLAPGRSSDLYKLKENMTQIIINDLRGKVVHLEVAKKKGKEHEQLLSTVDEDNSEEQEKGSSSSWNSNLLKWASDLIGGNEHSKKSNGVVQRDHHNARHGKTINIFSVASGHLYERFLKIMILSVLKNTQRPVKFWFIKNYLSPQFKDVIPHMAKEYGFEYELITYKWPSWLHKQKEKQRIIWAYKILFLDVIFPLSLEKVIFVDADQIVRADMGELYDMDTKGKPLAYTPFCDNNKDMDGYRFWRQGFWKEHLRGKPYHISALYVVDLVKFRQTAAGDNLRVFYETLSKDPNSLSNLDQASGPATSLVNRFEDLPNYAQHNVPIFSLPQEWLWCESWCGNATKSKAKTIDLCNNPMTKEPKLQGAKRIVSEWPVLDSEARQFTARILGEDLNIQETTVTPIQPETDIVIANNHRYTEAESEL